MGIKNTENVSALLDLDRQEYWRGRVDVFYVLLALVQETR
jgi:hypothetical protein